MKVVKEKVCKVNVKCNECFAELEIQPSDVDVKLEGSTGIHKYRYSVKCPECKDRIFLNNMAGKEIPPAFLDSAKKLKEIKD